MTAFSTSTTACKVSIEGDVTSYNPCQTYKATVTSASSLAHAFAVSAGSVESDSNTASIGTTCRSVSSKGFTSTYTFKAPVTGNVQLSAICGEQTIMHAATRVSLSLNSTAPIVTKCTSSSGANSLTYSLMNNIFLTLFAVILIKISL